MEKKIISGEYYIGDLLEFSIECKKVEENWKLTFFFSKKPSINISSLKLGFDDIKISEISTTLTQQPNNNFSIPDPFFKGSEKFIKISSRGLNETIKFRLVIREERREKKLDFCLELKESSQNGQHANPRLEEQLYPPIALRKISLMMAKALYEVLSLYPKQETFYWVNAHTYVLEGIENNLKYAFELQKHILYYWYFITKKISSEQCKDTFSQALIEKYIAISNTWIQNKKIQSNNFLLPVLFFDKKLWNQSNFFAYSRCKKMLKKLSNKIDEIEKSLPCKECIPIKFRELLKRKPNSDIIHPQQIHPQQNMWECITFIQALYENACFCFILSLEEEIWNQIEKLWQIVHDNYPELTKIEKDISPQNTEKKYYIDIFQKNETRNKNFYQFVQKSEDFFKSAQKGFQIYSTQWVPISFSDQKSGEIYKSLQSLVDIYKKTSENIFYDEIFKKMLDSESVSFGDILSKIAHDKKKELASKIIIYLQNQSKQEEIILSLVPLLKILKINIINEDNISSGYTEHRFSFVKEEKEVGMKVTQIGYKLEGKIIQNAICDHYVLIPLCKDKLEKIDAFLKNFKQDTIEEIKELLSPQFWDTKEPLAKGLLKKIQSLIEKMDTIFYKKENIEKEKRYDYESLLVSLQFSLKEFDIHIIAGKNDESSQCYTKKLVPKGQGKFYEIGYPLYDPEFKRPVFIEGKGFDKYPHFSYCRGFYPALWEFWEIKENLPEDLNSFQKALEGLKQSIDSGWPENKNSLSNNILAILVAPITEKNKKSLLFYRRSECKYLCDLYDKMEEDRLSLFYPDPHCIGKKIIEVKDECEITAVFNDEPKGTILHIFGFTLNSNEKYRVVISAGKRTLWLDLFHEILRTLIGWVKIFPQMTLNSTSLPSLDRFEEYISLLSNAENIQPEYYPQIVGMDLPLEKLHQTILNQVSETPDYNMTSSLCYLLETLDTLSTLWYPSQNNRHKLWEVREKLASRLNEQMPGQIIPVSFQDIPEDYKTLYYMIDQPETDILEIRRRKLPQGKEVVILKANRNFDLNINARNEPDLLERLRSLFLQIWCILRKEKISMTREDACRKWEDAYYNLHREGRQQEILKIFNVFYEYSEFLEKLLDSVQRFIEMEREFIFLENCLREKYNITKVYVRRGEGLYSRPALTEHFSYLPKKVPGGIANTVLRVTKPAFLNENIRIQRGTIEIVQP